MIRYCPFCNENVRVVKNYSNFWLVFWIVIFFPVAIFYYLDHRIAICPNPSCGTKEDEMLPRRFENECYQSKK